MELRTLKYFLMVAREENITKAAGLLHITQPTLSRQMMQLEEELGVKLFRRSRHSIILTDDGMLLKQRAQEMIALSEKTEKELSHKGDMLTGEIAVGCGETRSMHILADAMFSFRKQNPSVQFNVYSANADDIKDRIEKGILDMGLLTEPVDLGKYEFLRMPLKEQWGALVRKDSPLAEKESVTPEDLEMIPLILTKREMVKTELENWFGDSYEKIEKAATYNLLANAAVMAENNMGAAICLDLGNHYDNLRFVPLSPRLESGSVMVWKKHQKFSQATREFIGHAKKCLKHIS